MFEMDIVLDNDYSLNRTAALLSDLTKKDVRIWVINYGGYHGISASIHIANPVRHYNKNW